MCSIEYDKNFREICATFVKNHREFLENMLRHGNKLEKAGVNRIFEIAKLEELRVRDPISFSKRGIDELAENAKRFYQQNKESIDALIKQGYPLAAEFRELAVKAAANQRSTMSI